MTQADAVLRLVALVQGDPALQETLAAIDDPGAFAVRVVECGRDAGLRFDVATVHACMRDAQANALLRWIEA